MFSNNTVSVEQKILKYPYIQPSNQQQNSEYKNYIQEKFQCPICLRIFDRYLIFFIKIIILKRISKKKKKNKKK